MKIDDDINLPYRLGPEALPAKTLTVEIVDKVDSERWAVLSTDFILNLLGCFIYLFCCLKLGGNSVIWNKNHKAESVK